MMDHDTGAVAVFVTSSHGGKGAVGRLADLYRKNIRKGRPVVRLAVESYKHKKFGRIETPYFLPVSWEGSVETDAPPPPNGDMNDRIPF